VFAILQPPKTKRPATAKSGGATKKGGAKKGSAVPAEEKTEKILSVIFYIFNKKFY